MLTKYIRWTGFFTVVLTLAWAVAPTTPHLGVAQDAELNVLVFGDWGFSRGPSTTATDDQVRVAQAMIEKCNTIVCDLALSTGDNFYPRGVTDVTDPQFKTKFEDVYFPASGPTLGVVVHPVLGDKDKNGNAQAQYDYSNISDHWEMPGRYYQFSEGDVDFFIVDVLDLDPEQIAWLEAQLSTSTASWQVIVGHNPIYSNVIFPDGRTGFVNQNLVSNLLPLLCEYADVYFAGSSHHGEVLLTECGLHLVVQGGGGAPLLGVDTEGDRSLFGAMTFGFTILSFSGDEMEIQMYNDLNEVLYTLVIKESFE